MSACAFHWNSLAQLWAQDSWLMWPCRAISQDSCLLPKALFRAGVYFPRLCHPCWGRTVVLEAATVDTFHKMTLALLGRFHRRALLPSVQLTAYLSLPDSAPVRLMCLVAVPATSNFLGRAQFSVWQQRTFLGALMKWILGTREAAEKVEIFPFTLFPNNDQSLILTWLLVHCLTWKKMFYF